MSSDKPFDVYWIDDSSGQIYSIAKGAMTVLWEREITSYVYIFGDDSRDDKLGRAPSKVNERNMNKKLIQIFREVCRQNDIKEWCPPGQTYLKKMGMIGANESHEGHIGHIIPLEPEDGDEEGQEKFKSIKQIMQNWSDKDILKKLKETDTKQRLDSLKDFGLEISALFEEIRVPDGKTVALDVCLLKDDDERIVKGLPSISMAIGNWCRERGLRCYIYSHYTYNNELIKMWVETYETLFNPDGDVEVHQEKNLASPDASDRDIKALISMTGGLEYDP